MIDSILERHVNILRVSQSLSQEVLPIIDKAEGRVIESVLSQEYFSSYSGLIEKMDSFLESFHFKIVTLERQLSSLIQDALGELELKKASS